MKESPTRLDSILIERITREGRLTFAQFMRAALYDCDLGYYNTERLKIGPAGDYYTSSNVHPYFGAVLASAFSRLWDEFEGGSPLTLVEMGAGTGMLAADVMRALRAERPDLFDALKYVVVESSAAMIERQRERLGDFGGRLGWLKLEEIERAPVSGIFFSNELVDAMAVSRVRLCNGNLEEQYVGLDSEGKRLRLVWDRPSTGAFADYLARAGAELREGQIVEINLDAVGWLERLSRAIDRGFLVTIDYGDVAHLIYGPDRKGGTLRSFHRHRLIDSPLNRVGEQDITASVNFTALIEYGRKFGFETLSYERQVSFLLRNGLIERIAAAGGGEESLKDRLAVKNLFVPGGASDNFRVLIQKKIRAESA